MTKDIEKEGEEGISLATCMYDDSVGLYVSHCTSIHVHACHSVSLPYIPLEFMKTLLLMEATLKAENEVRIHMLM